VKYVRKSLPFILALILCGVSRAQDLAAQSQPAKGKVIEAFLDNKSADALQIPEQHGAPATVRTGAKTKAVVDTPKILTAPTSIPITVNLVSISPTTCRVTSIKPQSVAKWGEITTKWFTEAELAKKPLTSEVTEAINNIASILVPYIEKGASPEENETLYNSYSYALGILQAAYNASIEDNDDNYRVGIVSTFKRASDEQRAIYAASAFYLTDDEQKARYGPNKTFSPEVYKVIYERCFSCVGIVHPDRQDGKPEESWHPNVSGVLIAPNLVLTCSHFITDETLPGENVQVWFDYTKGINDSPSTKVIAKVTKIIYDGRTTNVDENTPPLDFALLQIDPPMTNRHPCVLTSLPIALDTPVYVIGCPKGDYEVVHDSCYILFPYELIKTDYDKVKLRVHVSLLGQTRDSTKLTEEVFKASYEQVALEDGRTIFRYYSHSHGQHMPAMGADCDTFHGDSGGPVFVRSQSACCGILIEGERDDAVYDIATFLHHEKLLPMRVINGRLADAIVGLKGWPSAYNVSIKIK